ncbi:MAG TPA: DUF2855 domain-containing protein, partial [Parvularcula sp.]|nr:DUF2855 domain-containing protein [Parvularcula sp.]HBS32447.1 DUF2855 domain-containing protein [Parvularcula sp.]
GWGVIPVWGFADVIQSRAAGVREGERLYGYFPMGTHLMMTPGKTSPERLVDASAHRAMLPPVYNSYARVGAEPGYDPALDDLRALLFPLYATSFCLYDFLADNNWFGAAQAIIVSASSKTAIGLAAALKQDPSAPPAVGLTSARNQAMVEGLGLYAAVATYDDLKAIDAAAPAVIIDMSGNGKVLSDLHARLGDNMRYCSNVGVTHYEDNQMGPGFIRERSAMFFAPAHIQKRAKEWGPGVFDKKAFAFWREAAQESRRWLKIERAKGPAAMEAAFHRVRKGEARPEAGVMVDL